jgi:hypothetical protein
MEISQELEKEFNLIMTKGFEGKKSKKSLTFNEIKIEEKTGMESPKAYLQQVLDDVLSASPNAVELCELLEINGVEARANLAANGRLNGFSFSIGNVAFKGSSLGSGYSWAGLQAKGVTYDPVKDFENLKAYAAGTGQAKETDAEEESAEKLDAPSELLKALKKEASNKGTPVKSRLQSVISKLAKTAPNVASFCRSLEFCGIKATANLAVTGRMNGFSFTLDGVNFKGSDLGKGYSWGGIQSMGVTYDPEIDFDGLSRFAARQEIAEANALSSTDETAPGKEQNSIPRAEALKEALKHEAANKETPPKIRLQSVIKQIATTGPSAPEFCRQLEDCGIMVKPNIASTGLLNGFSFFIDGIEFKGFTLGDDYSWTGLKKLGVTYDVGRDKQELIASAANAARANTKEAGAAPGGAIATPEGATIVPQGDKPALEGSSGGGVLEDRGTSGRDSEGQQGSETPSGNNTETSGVGKFLYKKYGDVGGQHGEDGARYQGKAVRDELVLVGTGAHLGAEDADDGGINSLWGEALHSALKLKRDLTFWIDNCIIALAACKRAVERDDPETLKREDYSAMTAFIPSVFNIGEYIKENLEKEIRDRNERFKIIEAEKKLQEKRRWFANQMEDAAFQYNYLSETLFGRKINNSCVMTSKKDVNHDKVAMPDIFHELFSISQESPDTPDNLLIRLKGNDDRLLRVEPNKVTVIKKDREAILAALILSKSMSGNQFNIHGDEELKIKALETIREHDLQITFLNFPDLGQRLEEERKPFMAPKPEPKSTQKLAPEPEPEPDPSLWDDDWLSPNRPRPM